MKFSENWLREWVKPKVTGQQLLTRLNDLGLEVGNYSPVAGEFSQVVVGQIISASPHPDADRLRVCSVNVGTAEPLQIVCGAANARSELKAPVALIGAVLPGNFKIKKSKLRGIESHGMLCAANELGLAETATGLLELPTDAPIGMALADYLHLADHSIELDLTPNRGDCLSVLGVAREVALGEITDGNQLPYPTANIPAVPASINDHLPIEITAPAACPQYSGRIIKNINTTATTPIWLSEKLRRSGVRSIHPVVDVTNFVMLELGQPMHAFDLSKIAGKIIVRHAQAKEKISLLNNQEYSLTVENLLIADKQKPLALAGIMGGADSAISQNTQDIFLESAFFTPLAIANRARQFGLHTDSSARFERGVDPGITISAIERATQLLLDIVGGAAGPISHTSHSEHLPSQSTVTLRRTRIQQILGCLPDNTTIENMLMALGASWQATQTGWEIIAPSHRFDLKLEIDWIEEIARIYGYKNLPRRIPAFTPEKLTNKQNLTEYCKHILVQQNYHEVICYSFIAAELQQTVCPDQSALTLSNPITSNLSTMRTKLIAGLLQTLQYNLHRQQQRVRIFEVGNVFLPVDTPHIAGLCYGLEQAESWQPGANTDFYAIKGDVEKLLMVSGQSNYRFIPSQEPLLHPGQAADLLLSNGSKAGFLGKIHPEIAQKLELPKNIFVFELNLLALAGVKSLQLGLVSKYPSIRRDLAITLSAEHCWETVKTTIESAGIDCLTQIILFDVYVGKGVAVGEKSLAIGLILQDNSRTLIDEEVDKALQDILSTLEQKLGASLRK